MGLVDFGDPWPDNGKLKCTGLRPSSSNPDAVIVTFNRRLTSYEQEFLLEVCQRTALLMDER